MNISLLPTWQENSNSKNEVDSSLALTKLFLRAEDQVTVIFANYLPRLRTWLGQAQIEAIQYWSAYDELQQVTQKDRQPLDLTDFTWPKNAEFVRMYDRIVVLVDLAHYATIYFTYPKADLIDRIDLLQNGQVAQQLTIDDRGFVSRVLTYQEESLKTIDYLSQSGAVVATENCQTGQVQALLPDGSEQTFAEMGALIEHLVVLHIQSLSDQTLLVEPSVKNLAIAQQIQGDKRVLVLDYPFYGAEISQELGPNDLLSFQTVTGQVPLSSAFNLAHQPIVLGPFAVDLATKNAVPKKHFVCYWRLGSLSVDYANHIFTTLFDLAIEHEDLVIIVENDMWQVGFQQLLTEKLGQLAQSQTLPFERLETLPAQFVLLDWQAPKKRQEYLQTASVVIDLADEVDLSLQAQALAHGLPSLTKTQTAYQAPEMKHIQSVSDIVTSLNWLFDQQNWQGVQDSLIKVQSDYASDALAAKWRLELR